MKINQLKFGIYLSYISLFLTNIINLVLTPFIIKNLGQSEYGLYMLIGAFVGYIAVLDFGLSNTTVRFVAKYRAENDKEGEENFLYSTSVLYILISFVVLIVGSILYMNLNNIFGDSLSIKEIEIAKVMFIILVINLAFTLPYNLFKGIITAYERFAFPQILNIARTLLRAFIIITLLSLGYKSIAIVIVDAIFNVLLMFLSLIYVFVNLKVKIRFYQFNRTLYKEIFSYSFLIFISVIVDQIYWRIGHFILGVVASTSEVAIFSIGMILGQFFIAFSSAISGVFLPKITNMVVKNATGEELTNLLIKTGRLQLIILGLILSGFTLFGKKFILLWAGPGYETSWIIALLVMLPLVVVLTQSIGITILQAKNMHGFRAVAYLCIAIVNVLISYFFARKFGAIGATLGTTLSLVVGNILVMNIYYQYKVDLNILRFYREICKGIFISIILSSLLGGSLLLMSSISWGIIIIQCIIYCFLYFIVLWFFGMNIYEKKLFLNEIFKVKVLILKFYKRN